jgi:2'-5' RNA ligase
MSGGSLRLFLAVPLPLPAIAELRALQQTLATRLSPAELGLRFTRAEQLHLTLKFVGESSEARAAELSRVLAAEAHHRRCRRGSPA